MRRPELSPAADLFDTGWSRVRGRRGGSGAGGAFGPEAGSRVLNRRAQMVRAARGHSPAVFKVIRRGGCHTRAQLRNQLTYLTTKSAHVFDARGQYDGRRVLSAADIDAVARRFSGQWDTTRPLKLGHTSHLLMSFPIGTRPEHVRDVVESLCDRFFQGQGARFDYIAAVHTDRAHPHAHIVVNRQSPDGERFFLKRDHRFNYQAFRQAMVEQGDRFGLRLEATERFDRGRITFGSRSVEVQRARVERRAPVERERAGRGLDRALQQVALASSTYQDLAAEASRAGFEEVSDALLQASAILARGGHILPQGGIYATYDQASFDDLLRDLSRSLRAVEERIHAAEPAERPRYQHELNTVLVSISHLNPLGRASASLLEPPSAEGLYSHRALEPSARHRLDDPAIGAAVDAALRSTPLARAEILARLRLGAPNAALERQWLASDARRLAAQDGLDLSGSDGWSRTLDRLDHVHGALARTLTAAGVRRHGAGSTLTDPAPAASLAILSAIAERLRDARASAPAFDSPGEAEAFRHAVARHLTPAQLARLDAGDEEVLAPLADSALDRLCLAKAYLQAHPAAPQPNALAHVLDRLVDAQIDAQRLRQGLGHGLTRR
ncbi:relaxase/mobilization nuclease domain-containing protein [Rubellimicrobium aerolatum]|uniref:Relaxase/mobilization nuclease domain-containing protein n=1 Tax=Rubellimicrobium aerolatum TaxID=490979 RepID=A0ABW0SE53_9RHOB|nr:relaxase/mobilization nuclease domain-containing protein [Rubellimicrobium aerolatum]MBP1806994.1 hypothetical protein [Rubellimicrobium aerolatum]